jgi:high-affinity K+ transport system ATPase subunit B
MRPLTILVVIINAVFLGISFQLWAYENFYQRFTALLDAIKLAVGVIPTICGWYLVRHKAAGIGWFVGSVGLLWLFVYLLTPKL